MTAPTFCGNSTYLVVFCELHIASTDLGVESRQKNIENMYEHIVDLAAKREELLNDAINILDFFDKCDDFENWMKQKVQCIQTEDPNDTVNDKKKKFGVSFYS